ncbi:MAG: CpsD/CapB family tyrosine-protein kinase [Candidatus Hodarchaeota archaeon]
MSKLYDAIMKAQREQAAQKEGTKPSEPEPEPQSPEQVVEADQKTPIWDAKSEITPKEEKAQVVYEKSGSVTVGEFVAKPDSLMAEQFRKLRGTITTRNLIRPLRSVLVTSCMPGEGKTKVAVNLSVAIARGLDDSVMLVDADIRKRSLSTLLGLQDRLGLSDVLAGRAGIHEIVINTEIEGLRILPAGSNPPNPAELIVSTRMKTLLQRLKEGYNNSHILIDSTPIVSTSEVNVLSQMVDGIIVVIMADRTRRDLVKRELNTINPEKILGVVLNCAEFETSDYYHKYHKYYYGGKK